MIPDYPQTYRRYPGEVRAAERLVTPPAVTAVTRELVKAHIRKDDSDEDALIDFYISSAVKAAEKETRRALITQTRELRLDRFPRCHDPIELPRPPLQSVASVVYVDGAGSAVTWAPSDYIVDTDSEPGRIRPAYNLAWPLARCQPGSVTVRYVAGYGDAPEDVEPDIRHAMLLLIGHWFENRETVNVGNITSELSFTVRTMLENNRVLVY